MTHRTNPDLSFELPLWQAGFVRVAGLDEAGRGAWAGPVSAGVVVLPAEAGILSLLKGVRDSKQMSPLQRTRWAAEIRQLVVGWGVGMASCEEIDARGILPCTRLAMQRALEALSTFPQHLLVDAVRLPEVDLPQTAIIHGDARSLSIAAASVLAKTARDAYMVRLEESYPGYGFARHKGYGTVIHHETLRRLGVCPEHRRSYTPVHSLLI